MLSCVLYSDYAGNVKANICVAFRVLERVLNTAHALSHFTCTEIQQNTRLGC